MQTSSRTEMWKRAHFWGMRTVLAKMPENRCRPFSPFCLNEYATSGALTAAQTIARRADASVERGKTNIKLQRLFTPRHISPCWHRLARRPNGSFIIDSFKSVNSLLPQVTASLSLGRTWQNAPLRAALCNTWTLIVQHQSCCDAKTSFTACRVSEQPRLGHPAVAQANGLVGGDLGGALGWTLGAENQSGQIKRRVCRVNVTFCCFLC